MATPPAERHLELFEQPGHLIRRAQQIAVSMFLDAVGNDVTPVQYAVLRVLRDRPGIDQVTLAHEAALDTSTAADIAARLEGRGWLVRERQAGRQYSLSLTEAGHGLLAKLSEPIQSMNAAMLAPLSPAERAEFLRLLRRFVQSNNGQSRAPRKARDTTAPG